MGQGVCEEGSFVEGRQGQSGIASRATEVHSLRVIQGQLVDSEAGPG